MNISVIVPSYRSESTIDLCLQHILNQDFKNFEIVIVDSSPDQEVQKVVERYPGARLIRKQKKTPPGIARNIGADSSIGELLLFLDSDIEIENEALKKIWNYYQEGHECFCLALELGSTEHSIGALLEHFFFFHEYQKRRKESKRMNLPSGAFAIRKDLFRDAGGFKSLLRGEDTEFTERLGGKGVDLFFNPNIVAYRSQAMPISIVIKKCYLSGRYLYEVRYRFFSLLNKVLLYFMLPFLALVKGGRIVLRNLRYHNALRRTQILLLSPCIFILSLFWMSGIYTKLLTQERQ